MDRIDYQNEIDVIIKRANSDLSAEEFELFKKRVEELLGYYE